MIVIVYYLLTLRCYLLRNNFMIYIDKMIVNYVNTRSKLTTKKVR